MHGNNDKDTALYALEGALRDAIAHARIAADYYVKAGGEVGTRGEVLDGPHLQEIARKHNADLWLTQVALYGWTRSPIGDTIRITLEWAQPDRRPDVLPTSR